MRKFFSYGPIDPRFHFHAPRTELIQQTYDKLMGEGIPEMGHYITIWAPRQSGKTWTMQQVFHKLRQDDRFDQVVVGLEHLKDETRVGKIIEVIAGDIGRGLGKTFTGIDTQEKFQKLFLRENLSKPLILVLDEFDAIIEEAISSLVGAFRNIYTSRLYETGKPLEEKTYFLHAVALIGVRSVLGVENKSGSPFNVQRSVHIPNLTYEEVEGMFKWYEKESGQKIEQEVLKRLFEETRGQPGLTGWFGELLTETYKRDKDKPIDIDHFEEVYASASNVLPNANILNIISKAKQEPYKQLVLELFETGEPVQFKFADKKINFLYMNGIIQPQKAGPAKYIARFSNPFVQTQLFNYFSEEIFHYMGRLVETSDTLEDAITPRSLNPAKLIERYRSYLVKNREWLLEDAPRRRDLRVFEAVFHFNLYMYLYRLLSNKGVKIYPQFPTGNGKIDIILQYKDKMYGIELKSFTDYQGYRAALAQAAGYGEQLGLKEILAVFFVESIDPKTLAKYQALFTDETTGVKVNPIFVITGG